MASRGRSTARKERGQKIPRLRKGPWAERVRDGVVLHMDDQMTADMEAQLQAFRAKFGRDPKPDDPVFFDPDADTPQPMPVGAMHKMMTRMLVEAGFPPEIIYAHGKTDRVVLPETRHLLDADELADWDAAVAEYHATLARQEPS